MDSAPTAKMTCVMKANMECEGCRRKVHGVLINICGDYSVDIDAEKSTVKVSGKVDPKEILKVLDGKHAEVKTVKFEADVAGYPPPLPPPPPQSYHQYGMGPYSYPYPALGGPYDYMWHDPAYQFMMPPYLPLPPAAALPSFATQPPRQTMPQAGAPQQNSGNAAAPAAPPPPSTTSNVAKESAVPQVKSKGCSIKSCSIM